MFSFILGNLIFTFLENGHKRIIPFPHSQFINFSNIRLIKNEKEIIKNIIIIINLFNP